MKQHSKDKGHLLKREKTGRPRKNRSWNESTVFTEAKDNMKQENIFKVLRAKKASFRILYRGRLLFKNGLKINYFNLLVRKLKIYLQGDKDK